jgi:hypothetical protein
MTACNEAVSSVLTYSSSPSMCALCAFYGTCQAEVGHSNAVTVTAGAVLTTATTPAGGRTKQSEMV